MDLNTLYIYISTFIGTIIIIIYYFNELINKIKYIINYINMKSLKKLFCFKNDNDNDLEMNLIDKKTNSTIQINNSEMELIDKKTNSTIQINNSEMELIDKKIKLQKLINKSNILLNNK